MAVAATYYGSNGWLIELDKFNILIDPWLIGSLCFPPGGWFLKGELSKQNKIPENIDIILLTQGQPDHAHPPTLEKIDKSIPVIGSEAAIKIVKTLGFAQLTTLCPGKKFRSNNLIIEATSGAHVPNIENGYIITNKSDSIYIEPHGFLDEKIKERHIDVVITPVIDIGLPVVGKLIKGKSTLPNLIKLFSPSTIFASTTGGDVKFTGLISKLINTEVTPNKKSLDIEPEIEFINPEPGIKYKLETLKQFNNKNKI